MSSLTLFTEIDTLVGVSEGRDALRGAALADPQSIQAAYLVVEEGVIAEIGQMSALPSSLSRIPRAHRVKLSGRYVLPSFCDSHTHLVFGDSREAEFEARIRGASYLEIAAAGGGILSSARSIAHTSEEELFSKSWHRLSELIDMGTGALEVKTGYGLELEAERKMLRIIHKLRTEAPIPLRVTYLALHALPLSYRDDRSGYIRKVVDEMIPWVAAQKMADYVDVFCEDAFFSAEECRTVLEAALRYGLKVKLHAEQLSVSGGLRLGVELGARSVDHLEQIAPRDVSVLASSQTIATLLPISALFLGNTYPPARALIDAGAAVALASDFNPGSAPSANMHLLWSLACVAMRMSPVEALHALTINGAVAMDLQHEVGSIGIGKRANLLITRPIPALSYLPYAMGHLWLEGIMVGGEWRKQPHP